MAVRHRVSFRGDQRPWSVDHARPAPLDVVDLDPGRRGEPTRPPPARPSRWPGRRTAAMVLAVVGIVGALAVTAGDPEGEPVADPVPVTAPEFGVARPAGPSWIPADQVVAPPLRASLNRYWPTSLDEETRRVQTWLLDDLGAWNDGLVRRTLLVADPTRRAQVSGGRSGSMEDLQVRRLYDASTGTATWEWDRPGWGFSLTTVGVADADASTLIGGAVALPAGPSLQPSGPPTLDARIVAALGFEPRWTRWVPAAIAGGPFVGQGGLDTVEGYVYVPGPAAGPVLVSGVRHRAVRAADLAAVVGIDPDLQIAGRPVVALGYELDAPVGFRITGATRVLFDHDEDVTFELASDALDPAELVSLAALIDFDRLARFLRTG